MDSFFERPILNSPYAYPDRHWEFYDDGQPMNQICYGGCKAARR